MIGHEAMPRTLEGDVSGLLTALLASLAIGLPIVCVLARLPGRILHAVEVVLVAVLIPAACLVVWPRLLPQPLASLVAVPGGPSWTLVLGTLPVLLLPLLRTLERLPPGQGRAGAGLGAGPVVMLRLVWLPQLGFPLLLGVLLASLLDLAALLSYPGRTS